MKSTSFTVNVPHLWLRPLVRVCAGLLCISTAFPVAAGFIRSDQLPAWLGYLDVAVALIWVAATFLVIAIAGADIQSRAKHFSYQVYRGLAHLLLAGLVAFFIVGDGINWNVLLPGLAWRLWLFIYALPTALTVWEMGRPGGRRESTPDRL